MNQKRERLPGPYEKKYKSEYLKQQIVPLEMWFPIPCVKGTLNSPEGIKRLEENDLLFSFLDEYFPDGAYALEPNMQDGRFMLVPENVLHQGIGICVSEDYPSCLEVGHFWVSRRV